MNESRILTAVDGADVILPASYDLIWSVTAAAGLALLIWALIRWARTQFTSGTVALLWLALILMLPVLGPAAFLLSSPGRPRTIPHAS